MTIENCKLQLTGGITLFICAQAPVGTGPDRSEAGARNERKLQSPISPRAKLGLGTRPTCEAGEFNSTCAAARATRTPAFSPPGRVPGCGVPESHFVGRRPSLMGDLEPIKPLRSVSSVSSCRAAVDPGLNRIAAAFHAVLVH